jgi:energy-converting hydrogenase Eha subunit H
MDFTYELIFMQLVHISVTAVKQEMDKLKDREKWFVSDTRELELYRNMCINEQRMCFEIFFLSFGAAPQSGPWPPHS